MRFLSVITISLCAAFTPSPAAAGQADVIDVKYECAEVCIFWVTVRHADSGWDHFADRWEILTPDGEIIATRVLGHPHVNEQPFTRSLGGVVIPAEISAVTIRAHDSAHGYGGGEIAVTLDK
ncbi:MAG: hypothetical protein KC897_05950 [Candidatus Omnitrophica bacterium]|nr:hypothetical protein [Candidatus Omnitrophota bacterium]MCB9722266.1 hypothetical protein [Candidatus Omnitrophota bacterium]